MGIKPLNLSIIILLMVIVFVFWFYQTKSDAEKINASPNTVSRLVVESSGSKNPNVTKPAEPKKQLNQVVVKYEKPEESNVVKSLTYLEVYRMLRKFNSCQSVFYRLLEDQQIDPVAEFESRIQLNQKDNNPHWPTPSQITAVTEHAESCQVLLNQIEGLTLSSEFSDDATKVNYSQLRQKLSQHLSQMMPKTSKEVAIADVLSLSELWQQKFSTVLEVSKGDDQVEQPEVAQMQLEMELLNQEQHQLNAIDREMRTQQESDRIHEIWLKIRKLKEDIINVKRVNMEDREQAIAAFELTNSQLFEKLRSRDSDVFFEAQNRLEMSQNNPQYFGFSPYKNLGRGHVSIPFTEYVSPGDVIKSIIGIQDNFTFSIVINHATKIYHCELGADCGPKGDWSSIYCHIGNGVFHEGACSSDLLSFYQDKFMSENQWLDVQFVVNVLRDTYAQ